MPQLMHTPRLSAGALGAALLIAASATTVSSRISRPIRRATGANARAP